MNKLFYKIGRVYHHSWDNMEWIGLYDNWQGNVSAWWFKL